VRVTVPAEAVVMMVVLGRTVRVTRMIMTGVIVIRVIVIRVIVLGVAVRRVAAVLFLSDVRAHAHDLTERTLTSPPVPNQEQEGTKPRGSVSWPADVPNK